MRINFESSLKERLLASEKEAFAQTVDLCKDLVYTSSLGLVKNKHDAEDITQDTFALLFNKRNTIHPDTDIPSWLYVTAIYISKRFLRDRKIKKNHEKEMELMNKKNLEDRELQEIIMQEISFLSSKYREVLFRHYILEEKYTDIAHNLGINLSTVSMQIKRGLEQLRLNLGKKGYVVSSVMLLSLAGGLNKVSASCNLSSASITENIYSASSVPFKIYKPKKDSISLRAFRKTSVPILSKPVFFGLIAVVLLGVSIWFMSFKNQVLPLQVVETKITDKSLSENNIIKIWNQENKNLSELVAFNPDKIIKIEPKSKVAFVGNKTQDLSYMILPYKIENKSIKVSLKTFGEDNGMIYSSYGPMIVKNKIGLPFFHQSINSTLQSRIKTSGVTTIYIHNKLTMTKTDGNIFSLNQYLNDLEGNEILIHNINIGISEVKIEKLSDEDLLLLQKMVAENKSTPTIYSPEIPLPNR